MRIVTTRAQPPPGGDSDDTVGVYKVVGRRAYRGHEHGTVFQARIDRAAEQRAIQRGDILLLDRLEPDLQPGSWKLPRDWPPHRASSDGNEAPAGASLTGKGR